MTRDTIIAANWKMNHDSKTAEEYVKAFKPALPESLSSRVIIAPPTLLIERLVHGLHGTSVAVGAQNCYFETSGAYTGQTSPTALAAAGAEYVIIGHSETREDGDQNEVTARFQAALQAGLSPILCAGEPVFVREANEADLDEVAYVNEELRPMLASCQEADLSRVIIAYEPLWAIGTGQVPEPAEANRMIQAIRDFVSDLLSPEAADQVHILYGGSVSPDNIKGYLDQPAIDGVLIGGASLDPEAMIQMIEAVDHD